MLVFVRWIPTYLIHADVIFALVTVEICLVGKDCLFLGSVGTYPPNYTA
jgi:hypothetical protein